ncbi:MAG TPA: DNA replication/repair protein RecF [Methyloceanibacter sp.]|nr:DNA replication/repair protein RecF [Methyloceanibacter sp.]
MRASRSEQGEIASKAARAESPAPKRLFVEELKLTDFRNYASARLALGPEPVVLVGDNGSGKTNLLEAVSLLGPGHGLRARPYSELCRKDGAGGFAVAAKIVSPQGKVEIGTGLAAGSREESSGRTVRIGGKEQSAGALGDYVKLVWLIPAMDGLFTGPASERRRFLDRLVLAIDPKMRSPLGRYDRAMRQRNRLFQMREGSRALFESLEEQMAEAGVAIAASRLDALHRLVTLIERTREARGEDAPFPYARLALEGRLEDAIGTSSATEVEDEFRRILSEGRERDRAAARALEGPHLSDLIVVHGPKNAPAEHCSSGEQKALLIGLILAKAELIKDIEGSPPLVLLDEVAAHLDEARRTALFGEILRLCAQAWMTGTDRDLFTPMAQDAQILAVNRGKISA